MKKNKGRPKALLADAGNMEWSDIEGTISYGSKDWRMIQLRQVIGDGSVLPDNYLSAELAKYDAKVAAHVRERTEIFPPPSTAQEKHRKHRRSAKECWRRLRDMHNKLPLMPPILAAWRTLLARFERAVLDGDANWFADQAKAITEGAQPDNRAQFNAKIVGLLHQAAWQVGTPDEDREDLTLAPAGKFVPFTVGQIWDQLDVKKCPTDKQPDRVKVEGAYFENEGRCRDWIRVLAKKYLQLLLRGEQGKHDSAKRRGQGRRGGFSVKDKDLAIARLRQLVRG